MDPLQTRMTVVGLRALAADGFVLAGGYALQAHGFGDRGSDDIDLFTNVPDVDRFADAVERLVSAYRADGLRVDVVRQVPGFARLVVSDSTGSTAKADLGIDHRLLPPAVVDLGPVLAEADAVGSKVGAVYSRLEARDLIDLQAVLDSGHYDPDALVTLADQREAVALDREILAGQLRAGSRLPDRDFARYGASPDLIARIRDTSHRWAERLDPGSGKMAE